MALWHHILRLFRPWRRPQDAQSTGRHQGRCHGLTVTHEGGVAALNATTCAWTWEAPCSSTVDSKQKPPSISAVWCPWCHVGLRWAYGETEVRKITGRGAPIFSACWFRSTAPGFRNWHLPVHMGLLAHPRPCHRLAVPAAPHGPCTQQFALFLSCPIIRRMVYIRKIDLDYPSRSNIRSRVLVSGVGSNPISCLFFFPSASCENPFWLRSL